jgi:hypothetical protein
MARRPDASLASPLVPETPEELYVRAAGALRLPPVEEWETFPLEGRLKPGALRPPVELERPRVGAGGKDCRRCDAGDRDYSGRASAGACGLRPNRPAYP